MAPRTPEPPLTRTPPERTPEVEVHQYDWRQRTNLRRGPAQPEPPKDPGHDG